MKMVLITSLQKKHVCVELHFHNDPEPARKAEENGLFMRVTISRMGDPNKQKTGVTGFYTASQQVKKVLWNNNKKRYIKEVALYKCSSALSS